MLLLCDDLEENPGPNILEFNALISILQAPVTRLQSQQVEISQKVKTRFEERSITDKAVSQLTEQVCTFEKELTASRSDSRIAQKKDARLKPAHAELAALKSGCNEAESRSRRSYLSLFWLGKKYKENVGRVRIPYRQTLR